MPEEIYSLAIEVNNFAYNYDTYEYRDAFDDLCEGFNHIFSLLANGNVDIIIDWLNDILDEDDNKGARELYKRVKAFG